MKQLIAVKLTVISSDRALWFAQNQASYVSTFWPRTCSYLWFYSLFTALFG